MKLFLTIIGLLVLAIGIWAGFSHLNSLMILCFLAFATLLFIANLDRISEFKASGTGIEAKTREVIARAENTLSELQLLAKQVGALTLSLVKRSGRIGGYSDNEEADIKGSVLAVLRQVGIRETELPEVLREWHRFTEFDYAHAILGGQYVPEGVDHAVITEWKEIRSGGINSVPTPEQIRDFLSKNGFMNEKLEEYLKDYEHYREHRNHRRPEVWRDRKHWGRLTKN